VISDCRSASTSEADAAGKMPTTYTIHDVHTLNSHHSISQIPSIAGEEPGRMYNNRALGDTFLKFGMVLE